MSRAIAAALGIVTMGSVIVLLAWDALQGRFLASAHFVLGAVPLALIALSYLVYQLHVRASRPEFIRAVLLASAFVCWAGNQLLESGRLATLLNDLAIALFVVDVFLTIINWPAGRVKAPELL